MTADLLNAAWPVAAIGQRGPDIGTGAALSRVRSQAAGYDMTRRDPQAAATTVPRPRDMAKGFGGVMGALRKKKCGRGRGRDQRPRRWQDPAAPAIVTLS